MYKRILLILLAALFCSIFASRSYASSINFVKDIQNPLNTNFFVLQSTITKENGTYKMWFTGHNGTNLKIGYSTSTNGIDWPSSNFVTVNDSGDNHDPSLFKSEGINYIYYISEPGEGSGVDIKIKRAIANDSLLSSPQLINLPRQSWNSQKLSCPYVYLENGTYFLFYCGTSGSGWNLGLATSTDGINFTPCMNNPILTGGDVGNTQLYSDAAGTKHLLYHSSSGITEVESSGPLACSSSWSNYHTLISRNKPYDQTYIIAPTLLSDITPRELFYTAKGPATSGEWKLNRTTEYISTRPKTIIIPGFFASWNQDAVLHNQTVSQSEWKIPSYIREYEGLIKTLENTGLTKGDDFYIFPYDWRKSLNESSEDLRAFLQENVWNLNESSSINLVGHSMGGVLARIYGQKYPDERLKKLITVGAPHRGVVQAYQPLEAGETIRDDTSLWLGTKLLINLYRNNLRSDRVTAQTMIPSLYDLFPVFDFLKNRNGDFKPTASLSIQNTVLNTYADLGSLADKMTVIYGNKNPNSSPLAYTLTNRALIDRVTGDYLDGRPLRTLSGPGDYLVPTVSSVFGDGIVKLPLDHSEIIYSKLAISKILDSLNIAYQEGDVAEGTATRISPSILVTIQSPVEVSVTTDSKTYYPEDGIIFIPNPQSGNYTVHVKKLAPGDYNIAITQISKSNDVWEKFGGVIEERNVNEEDEYVLKFDSRKATPQIETKKCSKYKKGLFGFRRKFLCKIKNVRVH